MSTAAHTIPVSPALFLSRPKLVKKGAIHALGLAGVQETVPTLLCIKQRPDDPGLVISRGSIEDARFFAKYDEVVAATDFKLPLTFGRGERLCSCSEIIGSLVRIFEKKLGRSSSTPSRPAA